ncbi:MAG: hypothetical protein WBN66_10485 [Smithella sp.]|jgi:ABC-type transport system involved in multi-copper enzyme maturation permease subunit
MTSPTHIYQIKALALAVWKESTRDRALISLSGSGIILLLFSIILGKMAVGGYDRVIQNMGMWVLGTWGLISSAYIGASLIRNEFQRQTAYLILSRPVTRTVFLMGKFAGMIVVISTIFLILACVWLVIMSAKSIAITPSHFIAIGFIWGEWVLLAAFSLLLASFTSPVMQVFCLTGISFLGHWARDLKAFAERLDSPFLRQIFEGIYYILPNLEAVNFRDAALYGEPISGILMLEAFVVLLGWILTSLIAANLIFSRRKLL